MRAHLACVVIALGLGTTASPAAPADLAPLPDGPWTNRLGMVFRPVPGHDTALGIWEVRVADFAAFAAATGHDGSDNFFYYADRKWNRDRGSWRDPGFDQGPNHPAAGVSWRDAARFCAWLTEHERALGTLPLGRAYRLPTDAEWSAAAGPPRTVEEGDANYHNGLEIDPFPDTAPVGSFPPNARGFYDLEGNLWEYCLDREAGGEFRVIRGGSWQNWHSRFVGVEARGRCGIDVRITLYGFRVALAADDERTEAMRRDAEAPPVAR